MKYEIYIVDLYVWSLDGDRRKRICGLEIEREYGCLNIYYDYSSKKYSGNILNNLNTRKLHFLHFPGQKKYIRKEKYEGFYYELFEKLFSMILKYPEEFKYLINSWRRLV